MPCRPRRHVLFAATQQGRALDFTRPGADPVLGGSAQGRLSGGPDGVASRVLWTTGRVVKLQTGYVYHYAFAMLIGVALIITWFMFYGGAWR